MNNPTLNLKRLEKEQQTIKPKASNRKEIIKIRAEIRDQKNNRINQPKNWFH